MTKTYAHNRNKSGTNGARNLTMEQVLANAFEQMEISLECGGSSKVIDNADDFSRFAIVIRQTESMFGLTARAKMLYLLEKTYSYDKVAEFIK